MKNHQHDHCDLPAEKNDSSLNNLDNINNENENDPSYYTPTQAQEIVRKKHQVDMSMQNDDMDPIEWTVRKLVPIPAVYYWDVSVAVMASDDDDKKEQDNAVTCNNTADVNNSDVDCSNDQMTNDATATNTPPTSTTSSSAPVPQQQQYHQPMSADMVSWKIRLWHESIYSLSIAGDFITRWIAQPIAGFLGVTHSSPFSYVFDTMSRQEWETSQQRAMEQCRKNQQQRQRREREQEEEEEEEQTAEQVTAAAAVATTQI